MVSHFYYPAEWPDSQQTQQPAGVHWRTDRLSKTAAVSSSTVPCFVIILYLVVVLALSVLSSLLIILMSLLNFKSYPFVVLVKSYPRAAVSVAY
jgi:hypothetical protein